jgi:hypothetical protein
MDDLLMRNFDTGAYMFDSSPLERAIEQTIDDIASNVEDGVIPDDDPTVLRDVVREEADALVNRIPRSIIPLVLECHYNWAITYTDELGALRCDLTECIEADIIDGLANDQRLIKKGLPQ